MAEIVLGIGTSHSPMLSLAPDLWSLPQERDKLNRELVAPPEGTVLTYEQLLERADPKIAEGITQERFNAQYEACQKAIATLEKTLADAAPDVVVIVSDDQDEWFFEDNMPTFAIYWGDSAPIIPIQLPGGALARYNTAMWGYGDVAMDVPVDAGLGKHLIESLIDQEFDVAHSREVKGEYGGRVARRYPLPEPGKFLDYTQVTEPHPQGLPHGWAFVVRRIMNGKIIPIVPVMQNTCYPPNQPTPKRSYALGKALRKAIESWDKGKRVAVVASGGLSHFVVDEELDQMVIKGMQEKDGELLCSLPRHRLNSAASEIRNWITCSAAVEHLDMELIDYVPVRRSPAGTGGGWTFARWS